MAKDRACARKTDGSSLCPGPASPRDPRDPFALYVLFLSVCAFCPTTASAIPNTTQSPLPKAGPCHTIRNICTKFSVRCSNGCFSIAQLFQNVYLPGRIRQKLCNFVYFLTYLWDSFRPPLVPLLEIWYTFPTKYAVGSRRSHKEAPVPSAVLPPLWAIREKHSAIAHISL